MKNFPKFSDAEIQFTMSQPQAKLLIACMAFIEQSMDADVQNLENTSEMIEFLQKHAQHFYNFSLPKSYLKDPNSFDSVTRFRRNQQLPYRWWFCSFYFRPHPNEI